MRDIDDVRDEGDGVREHLDPNGEDVEMEVTPGPEGVNEADIGLRRDYSREGNLSVALQRAGDVLGKGDTADQRPLGTPVSHDPDARRVSPRRREVSCARSGGRGASSVGPIQRRSEGGGGL